MLHDSLSNHRGEDFRWDVLGTCRLDTDTTLLRVCMPRHLWAASIQVLRTELLNLSLGLAGSRVCLTVEARAMADTEGLQSYVVRWDKIYSVLSKKKGGKTVLHGCCGQVKPKELAAIVGPSGLMPPFPSCTGSFCQHFVSL